MGYDVDIIDGTYITSIAEGMDSIAVVIGYVFLFFKEEEVSEEEVESA